MPLRIILGLFGTGIVIAYAVISGLWVNTSGSWYTSLAQPSWQPPPWVFGLIWPYNLLLLIIAVFGVAVWGSPAGAWTFTALLGSSVALALGWAYLFYGPHHLIGAAICLALAAALTLPLIVMAWTIRPWLGLILIPYQVWLVLATSLAGWYAAHST